MKKNKKKGDIEIDSVIIIIIAIITLIILILIVFTSKDRLSFLTDKFYGILRFFGAR